MTVELTDVSFKPAPPWPTPEAAVIGKRFEAAAKEAFGTTATEWNVSLGFPVAGGIHLMVNLQQGVMLTLSLRPYACANMANIDMVRIWKDLAGVFAEPSAPDEAKP